MRPSLRSIHDPAPRGGGDRREPRPVVGYPRSCLSHPFRRGFREVFRGFSTVAESRTIPSHAGANPSKRLAPDWEMIIRMGHSALHISLSGADNHPHRERLCCVRGEAGDQRGSGRVCTGKGRERPSAAPLEPADPLCQGHVSGETAHSDSGRHPDSRPAVFADSYPKDSVAWRSAANMRGRIRRARHSTARSPRKSSAASIAERQRRRSRSISGGITSRHLHYVVNSGAGMM